MLPVNLLGKKRSFQEAAGKAISFSAAWDGDCSLCKALGRFPQLLLADKSL
jgi:hypothetical protein